ncbi:hypothetical protein [Spirosoma radiotolerans]|uniref:Uncharacterized protein n=1 Tax=Spirosoma radiotolerans TaxID=1379870 RepID=A0A0E3ZUD0_9BACT|nr:hypothetical protein [Spirosoma radiotolerans]AKD54484.1 hypothetical protein SD10_05725 [Spirosoma radiotolerans]
MAVIVKKTDRKLPPNHPLSRKFDTVEEAAQAKTDYVWNTVLKDFDWNAFMAKKGNQVSQK